MGNNLSQVQKEVNASEFVSKNVKIHNLFIHKC